MRKNSAGLLVLLAFICFLVAAFLQYKSTWLDHSREEIRNDFQSTLQKKEIELTAIVNELSHRSEKQNYLQLLNQNIDYYHNLLQSKGYALLIYENDSLQFWSDNSIPVENYLKQICLDQPVEKLNNGWFRIMKKTVGGKTTLGLMLIKKEYPFHNRFLEDEFQSDFSLPPTTSISYGGAADKFSVKSSDGTYLFTLNIVQQPVNPVKLIVLLLLNLLGISLLIAGLRKVYRISMHSLGKNAALFLLAFMLIALRLLNIYFSLPAAFYETELFSPAIYANSISIASLGDLLLHCLLIFIFSLAAYRSIDFRSIGAANSKLMSSLFFCVAFISIFFFGKYCNSINISIIRDSKIPFNINNLLSLNGYSYLAFLCVGMLFISFFLLSDKLIQALQKIKLSLASRIVAGTVALVVYLIYAHFNGGKDLLISLWFVPVLLLIMYVRMGLNTTYSFSHVIIFILLFSASIDYVFYKELRTKEHDNRKIFAENLAEEKDPVAEFIFSNLEKKFKSDKNISKLLIHSTEGYGDFIKTLNENYFSGYWEKYDIKFILYDSLCNVIVKSNNAVNDKLDHYEEIVTKTGTATSSKSLFYIPVNQEEHAGMLAKLQFKVAQPKFSNPATLYVELLPKFITEEIGYPQLLLDKAIVPKHDEESYSFAKYKDKTLVPLQHVGKYKYPLTNQVFDSLLKYSSFATYKDYSHYLYRFNNRNSDLIVVSKEPVPLLNRLTVFSYFFTIFSSLLLIYFLIFEWKMQVNEFANKFKNRIQFVLVVVVLSAILLIGGGTILFLKKEYKSKNLSSISEKMHSVKAELAHEIGDEQSLSFSSNQYLNYVLSKQSNVFFSDINFYDLSGNLIASSRPQIFEQGLVSQKIDPVAYYQLKVNQQFEFTHNEKIGELDFLSCYMPFFNNNNQLLGYLNLPYFNKQNELENEISSVLVALINVYVLLFVLSIVLAVLISNRIMEPLKLLQNKISHIRLGKSNELIEWKNKDEIGELITEYNRMILELSNSAEMLAKSERESAWREMAKQVAHEIKNPLTPIKLSAQHLERSYKDGAKDWEERLHKFTKTLVEQIDALSNIANEFSNFAIMPKANLAQINLSQIIASVAALYQNSEHFSLEVNFNHCEHIQVVADKDQLIRLFNNLIKNAIQAIPDHRKGLIQLKFEQSEKEVTVQVADNGQGIREDQKSRIFTPNFTTKSSGLGLGLAMAKNMVESFGGSISFSSEPGIGTIFYVSIPIAEQQNFEEGNPHK